MCGSYHRGMSEGLAQQRGTTVSSSSLWDASKPFQSSNPLQNLMYKGGFARGKDLNEQLPPPVQRSAPSSSGGPTSLGIRRGSSSARKQSVSSGRRTSKSKSFSTTR